MIQEKISVLQKKSELDAADTRRYVRDMHKLTLKMIMFFVTLEISAAVLIVYFLAGR